MKSSIHNRMLPVLMLMGIVPTLSAQLVADGATNTLSNVTNIISGGVTVGTNGSFTLLVLANNCLLTNSGLSEIGRNVTARSNEVRLTSASARWHLLNPLHVGVNGSFNRLAISNGASVRSSQGVIGSSSASASNNTVVINGPGSEWTVPTSFIVGLLGAGNRLEVSDGGRVITDFATVGDVASNNLALVTGSGSVWSNATDLNVGASRAANQLVVSNGGQVLNSAGYIGRSSSASSNNLALVTGAGSTWNQADLYVGFASSSNQLVVSNGGTVTASNLFVGFNTSATNNRVTVDGGTLRVTNLTGNGTLDVRRGVNVLNAGLIEVDRLLVTNTAGRFEFDGGTLSTRSTIATNGLSIGIGNGANAAKLILAGNGAHIFTSLFVDNLGTLTGNGTISFTVPTVVLVSAGGIVSPGASIGKMVFTNQLLVSGTIFMEISRNGTVLTNDQIQISGGLSHSGHLAITNIGSTPLAAGDKFPLFSAAFSTASLLSLTLPPLGTGLTWTNKLPVDGSIEVLGLIVQTLPASSLVSNTVTLNGVVTPGGNSATAWFEWGSTTNYGNVTTPQALGSGVNSTNFSQALTNLFGGVTYHFRAVASNSFGIIAGGDQSFMLPAFYEVGAGLPGVIQSSVAWGDYDNDGRLDILVTGSTTNGIISQVWRSTGGSFSNINAGLPGVMSSSVAWGDYDNDGRLDIVLTGDDGTHNGISQVWRNTGSGFTNINANLPGVLDSSVAWGDYDNDGRLDILLTGATNIGTGGAISQIWRNTANGFININAGLTGVTGSSAAWGDYDNDGRLDILLTGTADIVPNVNYVSQIWRNTGTGFTNINALPEVIVSSAAWGDFDNDGRLDILLAGRMTNGFNSQVWRNTGSGFTNINLDLPAVGLSSAAWGDFDNDGRLDILLTGGRFTNTAISQVWRNTGSGFTNINVGLPGVDDSSAAWGDYDNDGRLDILLTGAATNGNISHVWRNNMPTTNTPPGAPSGLNVTLAGVTTKFTWDAGSDAQTPGSGLSHNLRIGTTPGGSEIVSPMTALRRLPQLGNAQMVTYRSISNLTPAQTFYWSVQAVDTSFAGSAFAAEQRFTFNSVFTPTNGIPVPGDQNGDGIVSQAELAAVLLNLNGNGILSESDLQLILTNYFSHSPFLQMTNVAGLGGTNVTFALTNSLAGAFSVEYTTNFVDWYFLGPATPRYLFTDTNAPAVPQRYYRLRWP